MSINTAYNNSKRAVRGKRDLTICLFFCIDFDKILRSNSTLIFPVNVIRYTDSLTFISHVEENYKFSENFLRVLDLRLFCVVKS